MSEAFKALTGEIIDPATIGKDKPFIRCQNVLANKMQCLRPAEHNSRSYCRICDALKKEELDGNSSGS
jgi:hypothetical protein